jgi:hypothetical protein
MEDVKTGIEIHAPWQYERASESVDGRYGRPPLCRGEVGLTSG